MLYDFAVVGGDRRLFYLAKFLQENGFTVVGFGLTEFENDFFKIKKMKNLNEALKFSKNWILPIPVSRDGIFLNCSGEFKLKIELKTILKLVNYRVGIFGGSFSANFFNMLKQCANFVYDYLENESFAVFNASLTAEAAVAQAVLKSAVDFNSSRCLILGFGRCGKLLALKLKNLCFKVVVCMRNETEMAWARAFGFDVLNLESLFSAENGLNLQQFNLIFNTIPKKILSGSLLKKLNSEVYVFDITSNGIDCEEFKKNSINAFVSLQIPGKFKFKSAAEQLAILTIKNLK